MKAFLSTTLIAAAISGLATAQNVHETAGVSLVEVPVTVVDRDGKPARGLTASDFEVRDDGKEVAIDAVDATEFLTSTTAPKMGEAPSAAAVPPAARRRFFLLFDLSFSTPSRILRIREAARTFVRKQMGPDDLAAVATFSVEHGMNLVVTFTPDRAQLSAAVETLGLSNTTEKTADPLQLTTLLEVADEMGGSQPQGKMGDATQDNNRMDIFMAKRGDDAYRRGRVTALIHSFSTLAKALDSVEGRKQVIYFSQGFDMRLLQGNAQDTATALEQNETALRSPWLVDDQTRFGNSGLQSGLNDMLDLFKRSDCVVHAVDLSGITAQNDQGVTDPSGGGGQAALFSITEGTGGELFKDANNFSNQLDRLLEEESLVYVLTFSPRLTGHPDKYHSLKVRVKRPGVRVSARAGYYEPKPFQASSKVEKNLTAADVIASEIPVQDIPVAVAAQAFAEKEKPQVMLQIHVPGGEIVSGSKSGKLPLEIYAYAFDSAGRIADFSTQSAVLDVAQVRARLDSGGLRYFAPLKLAPGTYRLRALVRNGETGAMGLSASDLVVPDFSEKKPYLVAPLAVGDGAGLVLRGRSARSEAASFPYMVGGDPFLPDARPGVARNGTLKLCLYTYGFGEGSLRIGGQILDAAGTPKGPADLALLGRAAPDELGRSTYLVAFKSGDLAAGKYHLRVMVQDPASGAARQATIPVEVR